MISPFNRTAIDSRQFRERRPMTQPSFATHEVFNQAPPFVDVDLFALDRDLLDELCLAGRARED